MSAVEVPAELIEQAAGALERAASTLHSDRCTKSHRDDLTFCPEAHAEAVLAYDLRALLPQPAPTCLNCGHVPVGHGDSGCLASACDCPFSHPAVMVALALLAAERDSKPAPAKPRTWKAGDPEPEDVEQIQDRDGDVWTRRADGWWSSPETREMTWEHIARKWSPLTEVIAGGAR